MARDDSAAAPARRHRVASPLLAASALLLIVLFAGLGTWQVYRLQWKLDLIARVNARVHAAPAPPPPRERWAGITPASDEYRHVALRGTYLYDLTTPIQALTEEGSGYWLLTPMCTAEGAIVIVNRGFIPAELGARTRYTPRRASGDPCADAHGAAADVTGLLRASEHGGAFTRTNDPAAGRWYTRDVGAIAAARGLVGARAVAPFFVDAAARQNPPDSPDQPVGGLTVVNFPNSHLVYAITWYALGLMVAGAWWWVARGHGREHEDDERHD
ncbi:SURF1 family protein [Massilia pinisoli]|uniref:SURF1-like protein n=1 Tax=Massilia pinisoli TaxID=1772194 RepID=A0ABT1ZJV6_9BURK|nr:SURF1 family protein [Massilia pinisoli]MCS0580181.1 SURF1 family protein [Massilia pinisoli]